MPQPQGKYRWLLVGWMFLITTVAYMDRVNLGVSGKAIMAEFHLTNFQLGTLTSAFLLGYAAFQIPDGRLADHLGPRKILTVCMIWWAIFTSLTASIPVGLAAGTVITVFWTFRFLLGAGEASMFPSTTRTIATWIPTQERGLANGWIFAGVGLGAAIAAPIAVWIMGNWGWRWSFWLSGIAGVALAVSWHWLARDEPSQQPKVSASEAEYIAAGIGPVRNSVKFDWGKTLRSRDVIALTLSYTTYGYAAYIFFAWFFLYMNEARGVNLRNSALYSVLPFIAMAICSLIGGIINDYVTRRAGVRAGRAGIALIGMVLAAIFMVLGSRVQSAGLAAVVLAGGAGALYLAQSSFFSASADIGGRLAGTVSGLMNMCNQLAGALTASLTPLIAQHLGWTASFGVAAVFCVLGGIAWLWVDPSNRLQSAQDDVAAAAGRNPA